MWLYPDDAVWSETTGDTAWVENENEIWYVIRPLIFDITYAEYFSRAGGPFWIFYRRPNADPPFVWSNFRAGYVSDPSSAYIGKLQISIFDFPDEESWKYAYFEWDAE